MGEKQIEQFAKPIPHPACHQGSNRLQEEGEGQKERHTTQQTPITTKTVPGKLADEDLRALLVAADLAQGNRARAEAVGLLHIPVAGAEEFIGTEREEQLNTQHRGNEEKEVTLQNPPS